MKQSILQHILNTRLSSFFELLGDPLYFILFYIIFTTLFRSLFPRILLFCIRQSRFMLLMEEHFRHKISFSFIFYILPKSSNTYSFLTRFFHVFFVFEAHVHFYSVKVPRIINVWNFSTLFYFKYFHFYIFSMQLTFFP